MHNVTSHADELFLQFVPKDFPLDTAVTEEDKQVSRMLIEIWTNFARTGNPNWEGGPKWER